MFDTDENPNPELSATPFDRARFEEMEIGDKVNSETGLYSVLRYKDRYDLLFNDGKIYPFNTLEDMYWYLEN